MKRNRLRLSDLLRSAQIDTSIGGNAQGGYFVPNYGGMIAGGVRDLAAAFAGQKEQAEDDQKLKDYMATTPGDYNITPQAPGPLMSNQNTPVTKQQRMSHLLRGLEIPDLREPTLKALGDQMSPKQESYSRYAIMPNGFVFDKAKGETVPLTDAQARQDDLMARKQGDTLGAIDYRGNSQRAVNAAQENDRRATSAWQITGGPAPVAGALPKTLGAAPGKNEMLTLEPEGAGIPSASDRAAGEKAAVTMASEQAQLKAAEPARRKAQQDLGDVFDRMLTVSGKLRKAGLMTDGSETAYRRGKTAMQKAFPDAARIFTPDDTALIDEWNALRSGILGDTMKASGVTGGMLNTEKELENYMKQFGDVGMDYKAVTDLLKRQKGKLNLLVEPTDKVGTLGKTERATFNGRPLPAGWGLDADGKPRRL